MFSLSKDLPKDCRRCRFILFLWLLGLGGFFVVMLLLAGCRTAPPGYEDDWTPGTNIEWNANHRWNDL